MFKVQDGSPRNESGPRSEILLSPPSTGSVWDCTEHPGLVAVPRLGAFDPGSPQGRGASHQTAFLTRNLDPF